MTKRESQPADVVVVGAGIIGLLLTRALAAAGRRVVCVGPHHTSAGTASAAAGAMLGVIGEVTDDAQTALDTTELEFRVESARRWSALLPELLATAASPIGHGYGTVMLANLVNEADRVNLGAARLAAEKAGCPVESMDPLDVPGLRPARGYEAVEAIFLPTEGWLDTVGLLAALRCDLAGNPEVTLLEGEVRRIESAPSPVVWLADGARMPCDVIVLAAGVGCQALLDGIPGDRPVIPRLLPGKGVSLELAEVAGAFPYVLRTPNRDFACGMHLVPRSGGRLYVGATNRVAATPGANSGVSPGEMHSLLHSAIHEMNTDLRSAQIVSMTHGLRPLTTDRYPLIGATGHPGVLIATGTYRNGVLMAPLVADLIVREVQTGRVAQDNPFSPAAAFRHPTGSSTHRCDDGRGEAAFRAGIRHLTSFLLEPGGHLPYDRPRELRAFLEVLGRMSLAGADDPDRVRLAEMLAAQPIAELVPQFFYEVTRRGMDE